MAAVAPPRSRPERRQDADHERGAQRGGGCEQCGRAVDGQMRREREATVRGVSHRAHECKREEQAQHAGCGREHERLGQQLSRDAPPAGAERRPHRQLASAGAAAREENVGHVRA